MVCATFLGMPYYNFVPKPILPDGPQHGFTPNMCSAWRRSVPHFSRYALKHVARKLFLQDGSLSVDSRFGCTQQDVASSNNPCKVIYAFNEDGSAGTQRTISSAYVGAFSINNTLLDEAY